METDFDAYLHGKKIDSGTFRDAEPDRWQQFRELFAQLHPNSFTVQKKYLINDLRRRYPAKADAPAVAETSEPKKVARPVIKRPVSR